MEEQTFHALYAATAKPLWAYIARMSRRPEPGQRSSAGDLLPLLTSQMGKAEIAEARPYLFRIATNLLHDRWRNGEDTTWSEPPELGVEPRS